MLSLGRLRRSGLGIVFMIPSVQRLTEDPGARNIPESAIASTSIGFELKDQIRNTGDGDLKPVIVPCPLAWLVFVGLVVYRDLESPTTPEA
jgi:hypothetical protein